MQRRPELRLTHLTPDGPTDVVVSGPCDSVGQLSQALCGVEGDLLIDGRLHPAHAAIDSTGIGNGSVIGGRPLSTREPQWRLAATSGPAAGTLISLASGRVEVGRVGVEDPTISGRHFVVTRDGNSTAIADAGSTNGTFVNGIPIGADFTPLPQGAVISAGATRLTLEPPSPRSCPQRDRRHHRPPRRPLPLAPTPIALSAAPTAVVPTSRFSWAAVIAPLLLGMGMAALFDWKMAAFALLSPLLGIGTWLEDKRRARHDRRAASLASRGALAQFRASLTTAAHTERLRRRALVPGAASCIALVRRGAPEIWERRPGDVDFGQLRLGCGTVQWHPDLSHPPGAPPLQCALAEARSQTIVDCPVGVSVAPGEVVGICGDRATALAVARSLVVQAATLHGPADLAIVVATGAASESEWGWLKWLPHHQTEPTADTGRQLLTIVDGHLSGSRTPVRVPQHQSAIVLASSRNDLPAWSTQIVTIAEPPVASLEVGDQDPMSDVVIDGLTAVVAEEVARALAPLSDPEAKAIQATCPTLMDVVTARSPEEIRSRWADDDRRHLRASIGFQGDTFMSVDLVDDGPHALVAGTTGSGKSELLRTWVACLASAYGPHQITFFLIDYKGGSAFDACARLPHVVGSVTDLDDHLAERALVSLDAEVTHRERLLRRAGVTDITAWSGHRDDPMPRLVIVIDEFAALQRDLPHFMDALVQIAQRGRSLGVHLVLATQRPQGVVSDSIRANTNVRICLRVQDPAESHDVIAAPDAASLTRPGTAVARIGNNALCSFEVAHSSAPDKSDIEVRPCRLTGMEICESAGDSAPSAQLERLVDAIATAAEGLRPPRRPWLPPLPAEIDLAELPAGAAAVVDDPARQQQLHWRWETGALLLYGTAGSGTTTALRALAVGAARSAPPEELHIYALDFGAGGLGDLALLPHTGSVISGADTERVVRCIAWLHNELRQRQRTARHDGPRIVVLVDGWSAFGSTFDTIDGLAVRDRLLRVVTEGASVGLDVAVSGDSPVAIPTSLAMAIPAKVVFRLADRYDYSALGVSPRETAPSAGACVDATTGLTMLFGLPGPAALADATRWPAADRAPVAIEAFSSEVKLADVISEAAFASGRLRLPLGRREDGTTAWVELARAEHVLVIGHRGTGRSTALATLAESVRAAAPLVRVLAIGHSRSPLAEAVATDRWVDAADCPSAQAAIEDLSSTGDEAVILVDDAERSAATEALDQLAVSRPAHVRIFAATRPDALRASYGHWLHRLRSSAVMLLLEPGGGPDADALVGRSLPRRPFVPALPGRGELVCDGDSTLVQVALP